MPEHPTFQRPSSETASDQITVRCVTDGEGEVAILRETLADGGFEVETATSPAEATDALSAVDCLLAPADPLTDSELLESVGVDQPLLPVVLVVDSSVDEADGTSGDGLLTAVVSADAAAETGSRLGTWIRRLVALADMVKSATRSRQALETAQEAIGIVAPDGTFRVVNEAFESQFGYDDVELQGNLWHDCFPESEVTRLESTALPTVEDGWQWTGGCVGKRKNGETFTAQTRITGFDDGSLVFSLSHQRPDE